jgi:hypothetical protein
LAHLYFLHLEVTVKDNYNASRQSKSVSFIGYQQLLGTILKYTELLNTYGTHGTISTRRGVSIQEGRSKHLRLLMIASGIG